jgi:hypothetical protein
LPWNVLDGRAAGRDAAAVTAARRAGPDDVDALLRLQCAHQQHVLGRPDTTRDDVVDLLVDPDLDAASVVLPDEQGALLGCALVFPDGGTDHVEVEVVVDPPAGGHLLAGLLDHALRVAASAAADRGHARASVDQGCYRQDTQLGQALAAAGFTRATTFHRMRRDLDDEVVARVPPGVRVQQVDDRDAAVLRAAMRGRGRTAVLLHVDSANDTGATAVYESVGMRPVTVIDVWRAIVASGSGSMPSPAHPAP